MRNYNVFSDSACQKFGFSKAFSLECITEDTFLISQPKHILWVLKRTGSMITQTYVKTDW